MKHIAICDDNLDDISNFLQLLDNYMQTRNITFNYTIFNNGVDLIASIEQGKLFDVYCLDVIMPFYTGIDAAKDIRRIDKTSPIVFFTSSPEYAVDSYAVKALNYILKPFSKEQFFDVFDDILDYITPREEDFIVIKSNDGIQKILLKNLVYVEVKGRNIFYHLISGKIITSTNSFSNVSQQLSLFNGFLKTHRSYIIHMSYIDTITNSNVIMQTNVAIPIAQGKVREIKNSYLTFQMEVPS